jgi:N-methylhydantoinase B
MSGEISWDGRHYPYIPPDELAISDGLRLHDEADATVDPVTHEVLRHALWNVNTEHGNTIMKISGSPICAYGHDFNPCILDERGNFVFFGPSRTAPRTRASPTATCGSATTPGSGPPTRTTWP